ncbi:hypothetical protein MOOTH_26750 [Moorella thermoacetica]|uniref:Uncharacterized protein n=1 Tax=Neomoorella thermoacetica TaxID=1525 RepID=A0A1J5JDW9_NEOTH|nr:hypothetical protein MOOR_26760 [Moorella thermoacetica]OIQ10433.1 hypothetical protein MOOTH_26750 [Moorella thermoacetica]
MLLVDRRVGPVPGVVRTGVGIKAVVTSLLQNPRRRQPLVHVPAFFLEILAGESSLAPAFDIVLDAEAQQYRKILTHPVLNGPDDLNGKGQPVL